MAAKRQRLILGTFRLVVGLMFVLFGLNVTDGSTPPMVVMGCAGT